MTPSSSNYSWFFNVILIKAKLAQFKSHFVVHLTSFSILSYTKITGPMVNIFKPEVTSSLKRHDHGWDEPRAICICMHHHHRT